VKKKTLRPTLLVHPVGSNEKVRPELASLPVDGQPVGLAAGRQGLRDNRPTLILIHGSGGSSLAWRIQLRYLDDKINVAALELPGHGQTPGPPLTSVTDLAGWLIKILDAWPCSMPPVLAGASLGGFVALETALLRPDLLAGLVLISTGPAFNSDPNLIEALEQDYPSWLQKFIQSAFAPQVHPGTIRQSFKFLAAVPPEVWRADLAAARSFDRRAEIQKIKVPTLVLCGALDRLTPPEHSRFLAAHIPGARLEIIEGAGHMVALERYQEVNRAVLHFVQGLSGK